VQRTERETPREYVVGGAGPVHSPLGQERDDGVNLFVQPVDLGQMCLHHLHSRDLFGADTAGHLGCR
jgi:hypothetical protein